MYRWQSPAPAAVVAYRTRRALRNLAHEGRAFHEQDLAPVQPSVPSMFVGGVEYVEARDANGCDGCAFDPDKCHVDADHIVAARKAFGDDCGARGVIYIRKA